MSRIASMPRMFMSVQYVRGLCAAAIVFWHGLSQLQTTQPHLRYPTWGGIAVDIFFVISGFVMWHMTMANPVSFGEYWRKRFARAIPFYWFMTTIVVAVMLIAPQLLSTSRFDLTHVVASYLFIPWQHPVLHGEFAPVIIPGWTLLYEIAFYSVLGFGLFVPLKWRAGAVIGTIMAVASLPFFVHTSSLLFYFYTQPLIADFASGILIGWMLWNGYRFPTWICQAAIVLSLIIVVLLPPGSHFVPVIGGYDFMLTRVAQYFVPAFLIVAGAVFYDCERPEAKKWKLLSLIGDAAYSIYIVHSMVLPVVTRFWKLTGLQGDWRFNAIYLALGVVASVIAGILCYRLVEYPMFKFVDRVTKSGFAMKKLKPVGV